MRKILITILLVSVSFIANAQDGKLRLGPNIGLTTGSAATSFVIGGDLEYLFDVEDKFKFGGATGVIFATEGNAIFLPLAGAGRFTPSSKISVGLDLGYVIGLNKSGNGFYFRPIFGYNISNDIQLRASYSGIESSGYFNVGAVFDL